MTRPESGIFVPLSPTEHAAVLRFLSARGFEPTGQGLSEFLRSEMRRRPMPTGADLLERVGDFANANPELVRTLGQVARAALLGRTPR